MSAGGLVRWLRAVKLLGVDELPIELRPTAYTGPFPIRSHRTVAELDADTRGRGA